MIRIPSYFLATLPALVISATARADTFTIDLEVKGPKAGRTVHAEAAATELLDLGAKPKPRAVLEVQAGDTITIKWTLASTAPKEPVKDVLVHFYAVKINKSGDSPPPKLDKGVLLETALTMDFKPKDKTEGELSLQVDKPGVYLLRLETSFKTADQETRQPFATLDLIAR